jgi:hypothetical protein
MVGFELHRISEEWTMSYQKKWPRKIEPEPKFGWTDRLVEYVDTRELDERGWTRRMIRILLGPEDNRGPVDHWMNFAGKKLFLRVRVATAEATGEFRLRFKESLRGRYLPSWFIKRTLARSHTYERLASSKTSIIPPPR